MSPTRRTQLVGIVFCWLFTASLRGNDIYIDVSSDTGFPSPAVNGLDFLVGNSFNPTTVHFTSTATYTGPVYTSVPTSTFFTSMGWTNIFTLLGLNLTPIDGAYLAITVGQFGNAAYAYSLSAGDVWSWQTSGFTPSSAITWTDVANQLFPPPPPPMPTQTYLPPPIVTTPTLGLNTLGSSFSTVYNPEPSTFVLLGTGIGIFWLWRRKRSKA